MTMNPFALDQKKQVETWAEQRDRILREISLHTSELEGLKKSCNQEALALTDLERNVSQKRGEFDAILLAEDRFKTSISSEVVDLTLQKSNLEKDIEIKKLELQGLETQKSEILENIQVLNTINDKVVNRSAEIDEIIGKSIKLSEESTSDLTTLMTLVKKGCGEIVELNDKNVKATNEVLEKLPAMLVELQKNKLIRHRI